MNWWLSRTIGAVFTVLGSAAVGWLVGHWVGYQELLALLGVVVSLSAVILLDTLRGYRLLEWLRNEHALTEADLSGFWGEITYRADRALRQRDQATVRERERLDEFLSAIEASPNGVMMLDSGDHIQWCNSVAADHFSIYPQRDRLQPVTNLLRTPAFVEYLQRGDYAESVTVPDPRGRGSLAVWIRVYGEGQKLVLSQDVTLRERTEAMRREFVANVSHEIRTPLTVLAGFIETMGLLTLSQEEQARVLTLMGQQAHRMQALVGDLLTLAQLEGSPRPNADRWVSMDALMALVESQAVALSGGRHRFSFPVTSGIELAGVQAELLSAFGNLVLNAVRYTPEGGRVDVSWRMAADGSGELAVTDTGPGIAREHLGRLTERFYRVDGSRSRETGGTGLGLSIVKHVVQRHGGSLDIQSEVGKGSTFKVTLPAPRVRVAQSEPQAA
jgi:two-component system phosphate regulon sensor histidine kinase PhoR